METRSRTNQNVQDQENMHVVRKRGAAIPTKRLNGNVRGALGEINSNTTLQSQNHNVFKGVLADDKKPAERRIAKSRYKHVQSKVDTGLAVKKVQPASRPLLQKAESTGGLDTRATVAATVIQNKKKLSTVKENTKELKNLFKQAIRDPTESLGKLKLDEHQESRNKQMDTLPEKMKPKLPNDIEDIDAGDTNTALLTTPYIKDIYKYLTQLEEKYPVVENHLANQLNVTGEMRAALVDWLVEVQILYYLELETFHMTVGIIDRYLQAVHNVQNSQLQLVGITAMFIASKYEEVNPPLVGDFVVQDNSYSISDVIGCEREILKKLGYCLARPIPLSFLRRFIKAAHGSSKNEHLAKYFVDLCLVEYTMAHYKPSELAAAGVCLSLFLLSKKKMTEVWTPTLSYYSGYSLENIEPVIRKIAQLITNVEKSKYKAVYDKYSDTSLDEVSTLAQLKSEAILELAKKL